MEQVTDQKKKNGRLLQTILLLVLTTLLFFGSQLLAVFLVQPLLPHVDSKNIQMALYGLAGLIALIGLLKLNNRGVPFMEVTGLKKTAPKNFAKVLPVGLLYVAVSVVLTVLAALLFRGFDSSQAQEIGFSTSSLSGIELAISFISLVILTPLLEEIIFRGVLFRGLYKQYSFWVSAIITSALFAVAHAQWNVALDTFALSIALCYLVKESGSIYPSILLHSLKNTVAFLLLFVIK